MRISIRLLSLTGMCCALAATVLAQTAPEPIITGQATSLSGFAGVASDSHNGGSVLGGSAGWDFTPALTLEGGGAWVSRTKGPDAFTGALKLRVAFRGRDHMAPFIAVGPGLYRVSFAGGGAKVPEFYRARMLAGMDGGRTKRTFMDPSFVFGGGINLFVNRQVAVRPSLEAMLVFRDAKRQMITTAGIAFAYHFEHGR